MTISLGEVVISQIEQAENITAFDQGIQDADIEAVRRNARLFMQVDFEVSRQFVRIGIRYRINCDINVVALFPCGHRPVKVAEEDPFLIFKSFYDGIDRQFSYFFKQVEPL